MFGKNSLLRSTTVLLYYLPFTLEAFIQLPWPSELRQMFLGKD